MKYYRLNFTLTDETGFVPSDTLIEVTKSYTPAEEPQFALDAVEEYETEYAKKKAEEKDKDDEDDQKKSDDNLEGKKSSEDDNSDDDDEEEKSAKKDDEEKCPDCCKPVTECACKGNKKKKKYSLDEIPEYGELQAKYSELETKYNALKVDYDTLEAKVAPLSEFKA